MKRARNAQVKKKGGKSKAALKADALARIEAQTRFLTAFTAIGTVTGAARQAGVGRRTHYDWLDADPEYASRYKDSEEAAIDNLEQEARRRAMVGVEEPIHYQGQRVDTVRRYSDTLLIFLLKGKRPEIYRERFEHTGAGGGPIQLQTYDLTKLSVEQLRALESILSKCQPAKP